MKTLVSCELCAKEVKLNTFKLGDSEQYWKHATEATPWSGKTTCEYKYMHSICA